MLTPCDENVDLSHCAVALGGASRKFGIHRPNSSALPDDLTEACPSGPQNAGYQIDWQKMKKRVET
jgi:hypothetical protein